MVVNLDDLQGAKEIEDLPNRRHHRTRLSQARRGQATVGGGAAESALTVSEIYRQVSHRDELDRPGQLSEDLHAGHCNASPVVAGGLGL